MSTLILNASPALQRPAGPSPTIEIDTDRARHAIDLREGAHDSPTTARAATASTARVTVQPRARFFRARRIYARMRTRPHGAAMSSGMASRVRRCRPGAIFPPMNYAP